MELGLNRAHILRKIKNKRKRGSESTLSLALRGEQQHSVTLFLLFLGQFLRRQGKLLFQVCGLISP